MIEGKVVLCNKLTSGKSACNGMNILNWKSKRKYYYQHMFRKKSGWEIYKILLWIKNGELG